MSRAPLLCRTIGHRLREAVFPLLNPPLVCMRCGLMVRRWSRVR